MTHMTFTDGKKRIHSRYDFHSPIEYRMIPDTTNNIFKSRTVNISGGGFCIFLYDRVPMGQEIEITKNILPFSCLRASVRWIDEVETGLYRAGMNFIW